LLADRRIRSLGEIEAGLQARGISFAPMLEAVMVLVGKGDVASAQEEDAMERALPTTTRLNQYLIENSTRASRVRNLASPVTGGGLHVQSFHLQMLLARLKGRARPEQWAEFLLENLVANGAGIAKREGGVMSEQESLAALTDEAHSFATNQLPGLRALKVVD
jgi:hypothetical protein